MEKAFYPRNDTVNATISNLLPRDGTEDILEDQSGDPVYLQRSSVLDGTDVRGFGYVQGHPYKWKVEIETDIKSIAVVPDRFFSTYGKSYPIKRKQTVGINQPSESFKYEIIYLRGYDKYDDEQPQAKIIYHKQAEENIPKEYTCEDDKAALAYLDDFDNFPYLKIRVCYDNSIKAYLGSRYLTWTSSEVNYDTVKWQYGTRDAYMFWQEIPIIDTSQFEHIDLWLRFDSINALSYYLITKYEQDIYEIGPKKITGGLSNSGTYTIESKGLSYATTSGVQLSLKNIAYRYRERDPESTVASPEWSDEVKTFQLTDQTKDEVFFFTFNVMVDQDVFTSFECNASSSSEALLKMLMNPPTGITVESVTAVPGSTAAWVSTQEANPMDEILIDLASIISNTNDYTAGLISGQQALKIINEPRDGGLPLSSVVGKDYNLEAPDWETFNNTSCTPCCKKSNLSRAIWAYVDPRTMTPYDDDYWFHQGEPYFKKSLTLSTKESPVKAQRIYVEAGTFPGMYKIVGETYIRARDTGEDQRVQLEFPLCKIKSNQTLTLQADGDPTTFSMEVEVATPPSGIPMQITFYEVEKDMKKGCCGSMIEKDGSTRISAV